MSLLGYDMNGTATINGLSNVNANQVYGDDLYYDSSTTPVNVKTAITGVSANVTILQGQMITANSNISTLQGQMSTAQSDINTLQSEMNTAQSDINTLQSEMNTAQADIVALYSTTATNTAAIAGLSVSQAAQDVTLAAHTASIATLSGDVSTLQGQVTTLQVKTTDQSWGSLTGTTFSGRVNVGSTSAGVVLNTSTASEFGSGILTPSVEPLAVGSNLAIGANQTSGTLNLGTLSTRSGAINMGTGASAKTITIGSTNSTVAVNGTTTIAGTTNINTTTLLNTNIGNGPAGGNISLEGAINTIKGTTNVNSTGTYGTTIGNTTGTVQINSGILDINANNAITIDGGSTATITTIDDLTLQTTNPFGDISVVSAGTTTLTSTGTTSVNVAGTAATSIGNITGNIAITGATNTILGTTNLNVTGGANTTIGTAGSGNTVLKGLGISLVGSTLINDTGTAATSIGNTSATLQLKGSTNTITGVTNINHLNTLATTIGNTTGVLTLRGATNINTTGTASTAIGSATSATTITGDTNINTSGLSNTNIGVNTATSGSVLIQGQNINFIAYNSIQLEATNAYWTNIGQGNFYYRAYNGLPQWILGNQTTAVDYMSIQSTATGSTITVYASQPLTLSASAVTANNLVAANATLTTSTVTLSVPLQMDNAYVTYPISTATAVGRYQSTTGTTKFTAAATNILSLAIPRAGCYIVEAQFYFSGTIFTPETFTIISISTTSGVIDNTRQITAYQGGASGNYAGHITSVVNFTSASTVYFVGTAQNALGATSAQSNFMSITRIA